ncbi:hypothetical protein F5884DRAFT_150161 [Xylogone sp. PMI_703]|nr:hypothetical protein F5884DRAFT_150161 [Xylogone sp. PMI_703]
MATYISPSAKDDNMEWEHAQFVIQQNVSYSCYSMALTFNITTGRTCVLIFGAESWSLSELFAYLGSISPLPFGPMLVPAVAMELQAKWFSATVHSCHNRIYDIETTTGMRRFDNPQNDHQTEMQDWKSVDLIDITRDLNSLLSRVAFLKLQSETGLYLTQQMQISVNSLKSRLEKVRDQFKIETQDDIISKLEHIQSWYSGILARLRYLTGRIEAQIQTVYCLVASQDNITMRTITELSRQDNRLMLQIAEDSRAVALATARDSAAMRVIAAVTILFLPATFTSTFFSMTFFNFLDGDKPQASPWISIYVIVTVILTAIIQTTWAIISKKKESGITQTLLHDQAPMGNRSCQEISL